MWMLSVSKELQMSTTAAWVCVMSQNLLGKSKSDLFSHTALCVCLSSATIRNAFLLLLVATSTWLCGLMAVNNSILAFYYIFDVLCLVQV